jgi:hypothetical protein
VDCNANLERQLIIVGRRLDCNAICNFSSDENEAPRGLGSLVIGEIVLKSKSVTSVPFRSSILFCRSFSFRLQSLNGFFFFSRQS